MRTAWIIGMAMAYVILSIVSGIDEGTYFGGSGIDTLWIGFSTVEAIDYASATSVVSGVLVGIKSLLTGIVEILTWKFSFFVGPFVIFRLILASISLGIMVSLILALRGTASG